MDPRAEVTPPLAFHYQFRFESGRELRVTVRLDGRTLTLLQTPREPLPDWTALTHRQCPNCPLSPAQSPRCPAAVSLVELVEAFAQTRSIEQVTLRVEAEERVYEKRTSIQEAVSALLGVYMATSGCPVMAKLKPMVRFHLPFATVEETHFRAFSTYLVAQYLIAKRGGRPDWECRGLVALYEQVMTVNEHFFKRLAGTGMEDAGLNALVRLDLYASAVAVTAEEILEEVQSVFEAYLS